MIITNVWKISSGRFVEKVMMDYALSFKYEHPVHSIILNPDDPSYVDIFTEQELQEIQDLRSIDFNQNLPADLHQYIYSFSTKKSLSDLYNTITAKSFNPSTQGDLYWARKSSEETLDLYHFDFFENDYFSSTLYYKSWKFIIVHHTDYNNNNRN
ncbi:hypothetical protein BDC45DRAFT_536192 [Circinella umbellata]|nr:hypothetical protein BDC45DRAFT_536192 [Circinella umbellata]